MTPTEIKKIGSFFKNDRIAYRETFQGLINEMSGISFKIKVLNASIQLHDKEAFAVIGFRRSKAYFFVEFYSSENIDNPRIIKTIRKSEQQIINRVNISSKGQIDQELLNWIQISRTIAARN